MKKIIKLPILLVLFLGFTFTSCETTDLNLLDDPNNITLDKADLNRYLTAIQLDFRSFINRTGSRGSELTRINYMFGRTYANNYQPVSSNGMWADAYQNMFSDMVQAENIASELGENNHIGVIKILKGYTLMTLVDFFGDVPYSEATQPVEFPFPNVDPGSSVYAAAINLLDEGIALLNSNTGNGLEIDFYYNNDFSKWIKAANTMKMAAYLNTRLVDSDASSKFNAIVNSGNWISETADDFEFKYGTNVTDPNTRHPEYDSDYTATGAGDYRSNWLMNNMLQDNDPRIRFYFFRQWPCTPNSIGADGNYCEPDQQRLICSTQARPPHYSADMIFCSVDNGYWGRDHGNAEGIPPDNFRRSVIGVYPAGGKFDGDEFTSINIGVGGGGAGITPVLLASWSHLMVAEMALVSGNTGSAATHLQHSLDRSVAKVVSFASLDAEANTAFIPTSADIGSFITTKIGEFNSANLDGKWDILATQQFVAHYGNGIDSYNMYRRTGYPTSLQFNVEPSSGNFIRSFLYPSNEADVNSNISQKPNVDVQVFWDNNPASPGFPFAN